MRFAYADPPYPGMSRLYRDHSDYAGEVDHEGLIMDLDDYDGWALSTAATTLRAVLLLCPADIVIAAWGKQNAPHRPPNRLVHSWEAVLVSGGRRKVRYEGDYVRTFLNGWTPQGFLKEDGPIGQKGSEFAVWVFGLLGLEPEDELVDLFPGSGSVGRAWEAWRSQLSLLDVRPLRV